MSDGPKETAVRATLATRPAGILEGFERGVRNCFKGLFNGASREGHIWPNGAFKVGKAECEWGWPGDWEKLRDAGLLTFRLDARPNHPSIGGSTTYVPYSITDKGWDVREDDIAYFRELMAAREKDEAVKPGSTSAA